MSEELYDLVNEDNELIDQTKPKSQVHKDGDWHRASHIWILNSQKQLLIQQRSAVKESQPNRWDISVGGHISAGESPEDAAVRELQEELGIEAKKEELEFLFSTKEDSNAKESHFTERVFQYVYMLKRDVPISDIEMQESEVQAVKYVTVDELESMLKTESFMPHWEEYDKIIQYVKNL